MMLLDEHTSKKLTKRYSKNLFAKPTNPTGQCVHPKIWMILLDEETPQIN
jgi:hypothetical protein